MRDFSEMTKTLRCVFIKSTNVLLILQTHIYLIWERDEQLKRYGLRLVIKEFQQAHKLLCLLLLQLPGRVGQFECLWL